MSVKHRPATPLPWEQNHPAIARVLAVDGIDPRDVPYIIHAANAYQKLVEALRKAAPHIRNGAAVDAVFRLLEELGEEA